MVMFELADALNSSEGRDVLSHHGVYSDPEEFVERLRPPIREGFAAARGRPWDNTVLPVYSGQQIYADYRQSVVAKICALARLRGHDVVGPTLLWLDTDRSGSDKAMTTIRWPGGARVASTSLAARSTRSSELRFVNTDPALVQKSWDLLGSRLAQSITQRHLREEAVARHHAIGIRLAGAKTLAEVNEVITSVLLREGLGIDLPGVLVSDLASKGLISGPVERMLTHIDSFVAAFNDAIGQVAAAGINPHLRALPPDYLPLFYSCPTTNDRERLVHVRDGAHSFGIAACSHHDTHRFSLGRDELSLHELEATGRWSPDVTLPIYLDGLVSGVVAGRSSALYGIVLGIVQERVFGSQPCPVLVPEELSRQPPEPSFDSLLFSYLTGTSR